MPKLSTTPPAPAHKEASKEPGIDTSYLQTLLGYNARRAALSIIEVFLVRMKPFNLRPVDFSVLSVIAHNAGITSRQLCTVLNILPPNFVAMLAGLEKRGLVERRAHPSDKRAQTLYLTQAGQKLMQEAENTAEALEIDATAKLSAKERQTLIGLLQKVYLP
jgi:DNA-binding MarR family transcriptional regulator